MNYFVPKRIFYEPEALNYPLGAQLVEKFGKMGIPVVATSSHNRVTGIPGKTASEGYLEAKLTLVIGVRRSKTFQSCKPSAHYQLPLVTSCPGMCEYCYLATTLGKKPYVRVYVNVEEILELATKMINERLPEITLFEGAATSDPIPVERYTGTLKRAIEFFGEQTNGRFRFVTKFSDVDSLLTAKHEGHTRLRFSLNSESIVKKYEHGTPPPNERIKAAGKVAKAGYPLGFIIAPIFLFEGWQIEYEKLFSALAAELEGSINGKWKSENLSFEFISHRFTEKAKTNIMDIFPETQLPMDKEERKYKYGQFGYGKYVYKTEDLDDMKGWFLKAAEKYFPGAEIEYFI